jgi:hypothetical protein
MQVWKRVLKTEVQKNNQIPSPIPNHSQQQSIINFIHILLSEKKKHFSCAKWGVVGAFFLFHLRIQTFCDFVTYYALSC